jgi:hypothetical protein
VVSVFSHAPPGSTRTLACFTVVGGGEFTTSLAPAKMMSCQIHYFLDAVPWFKPNDASSASILPPTSSLRAYWWWVAQVSHASSPEVHPSRQNRLFLVHATQLEVLSLSPQYYAVVRSTVPG